MLKSISTRKKVALALCLCMVLLAILILPSNAECKAYADTEAYHTVTYYNNDGDVVGYEYFSGINYQLPKSPDLTADMFNQGIYHPDRVRAEVEYTNDLPFQYLYYTSSDYTDLYKNGYYCTDIDVYLDYVEYCYFRFYKNDEYLGLIGVPIGKSLYDSTSNYDDGRFHLFATTYYVPEIVDMVLYEDYDVILNASSVTDEDVSNDEIVSDQTVGDEVDAEEEESLLASIVSLFNGINEIVENDSQLTLFMRISLGMSMMVTTIVFVSWIIGKVKKKRKEKKEKN